MTDNEKIQSFGDMVQATERLTRPWKVFVGLLLAALVLTNAIWGFVHWKQLQYAYMTPTEITQNQEFDQHTQNQSYSEGVTSGE